MAPLGFYFVILLCCSPYFMLGIYHRREKKIQLDINMTRPGNVLNCSSIDDHDLLHVLSAAVSLGNCHKMQQLPLFIDEVGILQRRWILKYDTWQFWKISAQPPNLILLQLIVMVYHRMINVMQTWIDFFANNKHNCILWKKRRIRPWPAPHFYNQVSHGCPTQLSEKPQ